MADVRIETLGAYCNSYVKEIKQTTETYSYLMNVYITLDGESKYYTFIYFVH